MVVIGGTVLTGGRGTIVGTVIGIFILRIMRTASSWSGYPDLRTIFSSSDHPRHDGAAFSARKAP